MSIGLYFNVSQVVSILNERLDFLDQLIDEKTAAVAAAPEGSLKVVERRGSVEYYWRSGPIDKTGKYLRFEFDDLIRSLAQKEYDRLTVENAVLEKTELQKLLTLYEIGTVESTHDRMKRSLKVLTEPFAVSDEEFMNTWLSQKFESNPSHPEQKKYRVTADLVVRSKGEQDIATILLILGIPFFYEKPMTIFVDDRDITIYPDFTILDVSNRREIIWEHLGMMDVPNYLESSVWKIKWYQLNGYVQGEDLFITMEGSHEKLDMLLVKKIASRIAQTCGRCRVNGEAGSLFPEQYQNVLNHLNS